LSEIRHTVDFNLKLHYAFTFLSSLWSFKRCPV